MRLAMAVTMLCTMGSLLSAQGLPTIQRENALGGLRALGGADEAAEWRAVGRLDTGVSFCSATLIAPDVVLTAAHCLYHPETDAAFVPDDLTFSAGLRNGRAAAVRGVRRTVVLPDYTPEIGEEMDMIGADLALLQLQHPISEASIQPIPTGRTGRGDDPVTVVSYGMEREAYASIEEGCEILARRGPVRSLSCEVVSGASGSPVLRIAQGRAEIVAVMSAMAEVDGEAVSLAVILDDQLAQLLDQYEREGGIGLSRPSQTLGGTAFLGQGNDGRETIGARFIRP
ncbi:serine protease [Hasllibacter sp. MH4015]|uniref:trypsin-like serine peptidase n=1 Tax=Hasllibacter sp. MH4015 TaxID=2854029 RepID=UPI001CD7E1B9|nr:trypsin-like peptidase domain-containing protein [Hasllibacter sp. MH4015]